MTGQLPSVPGPSMRTFVENWPAAREIIVDAMQSCAEASAAAEQALTVLRVPRAGNAGIIVPDAEPSRRNS